MPFDLILRGGRVIDPSQKLDAVTDIAFAGGKVAPDRAADLKADAGHRGSRRRRRHRHAGADRSPHPRLLGRHLARHRRRGLLPPVRRHHGDRHRQRRPRQFRRLPQARDRAERGAHPRLSPCLLCRHLRLLQPDHGRRERGDPPDGADRRGRGGRRQPRPHRRHQGAGRRRVPRARSGTVPLDIALQVADEVGVPLMAHIDDPPPSYEEVLARLRPGDVLTHAFRPFPNSPATAQGTVKRAVLEARERGVLFDIGHGKGSFAFKTARAMLANGFSAGHHLVRRPPALHRRPGVRPRHDDVEVPVPRHVARRCDRRLDRQCRDRARAARSSAASSRAASATRR